MMRCVDRVRAKPWWALLQLAIACIVTMASLITVTLFVYESRPSQLGLIQYTMEPRAEGAGVWLVPHFHWSESALRCGRIVDMRLYPVGSESNNLNRPILLATFIGGPRFTDNQAEIWPKVLVPIGTHGEWDFVSRVSFLCPPAHLISWATSTTPVRVKLP